MLLPHAAYLLFSGLLKLFSLIKICLPSILIFILIDYSKHVVQNDFSNGKHHAKQ